jgi:acyl carrier protein
MQPLVNSIQKLLKRKLNIYPSALSIKTDLKKDLDLVDWEMAYLLNAVEQTWHIHISENDASNIASMGQLIAVVRREALPPARNQ